MLDVVLGPNPSGWKTDAENLSSQEQEGKPCDIRSPEERGLADVAQVESHLQTEIGLEPSQELGIRLVGSSPSAGGILQV